MLRILLDNAVRYSPSDGRVHVSARDVNGAIEVRVEDEGVGIPPAEREHVFRKFFRGESAARDVGSGRAGLGLFIARSIAEAHGGSLDVQSETGAGTAFTFRVPVA